MGNPVLDGKPGAARPETDVSVRFFARPGPVRATVCGVSLVVLTDDL
jgi:hypothetical protein